VKPTEDTQKRVKNMKLAVNADANRRVFADIVQAFDKSKARESAEQPPGIWRAITRTTITRLAAAAVVLIAIGFVIAYRNRDKQAVPPSVAQAAKSPAKMLTALSLQAAYRRGGIEAVENQYQRAFEMLGPRQTGISVEQVLAELDGS
jgi:hypothetical protein